MAAHGLEKPAMTKATTLPFHDGHGAGSRLEFRKLAIRSDRLQLAGFVGSEDLEFAVINVRRLLHPDSDDSRVALRFRRVVLKKK